MDARAALGVRLALRGPREAASHPLEGALAADVRPFLEDPAERALLTRGILLRLL